MRQRPHDRGDVVVWGSVSVMRSLLAAGEVDELDLFVAPIALGAGTPLLDPGAPPVPLRLLGSEVWPASVLHTRYAVAGPRRCGPAPVRGDGQRVTE